MEKLWGNIYRFVRQSSYINTLHSEAAHSLSNSHRHVYTLMNMTISAHTHTHTKNTEVH